MTSDNPTRVLHDLLRCSTGYNEVLVDALRLASARFVLVSEMPECFTYKGVFSEAIRVHTTRAVLVEDALCTGSLDTPGTYLPVSLALVWRLECWNLMLQDVSRKGKRS